MPYLNTRRQHGIFARKISRYFTCRKAKRMYNEISREMDFFENRFLKSRINHT